jgi:8-oxo-dGTP pyrophosphatase MutT (NUDIX family)
MKQLATKVVYQNKWMTVREDQVEFDNGSQGIYGVVEKPDFALIVPFDGEHFYLVEQYRYPVRKRFWEFPQGSYESDPDKDPIEVAKAELKEEAGVVAAKWERIGFLFEAYGYCNQGFHLFLATDLTEGEQQLESSEQGMRVKKCTVAEFEQMVLFGEITDAPTLSAYGMLKLKKVI